MARKSEKKRRGDPPRGKQRSQKKAKRRAGGEKREPQAELGFAAPTPNSDAGGLTTACSPATPPTEARAEAQERTQQQFQPPRGPWERLRMISKLAIPRGPKALLKELVPYGDMRRRRIFPSIPTLAAGLTVSEATARRAKDWLRDNDWVRVTLRHGSTSVYDINWGKIAREQPSHPSHAARGRTHPLHPATPTNLQGDPSQIARGTPVTLTPELTDMSVQRSGAAAVSAPAAPAPAKGGQPAAAAASVLSLDQEKAVRLLREQLPDLSGKITRRLVQEYGAEYCLAHLFLVVEKTWDGKAERPAGMFVAACQERWDVEPEHVEKARKVLQRPANSE